MYPISPSGPSPHSSIHSTTSLSPPLHLASSEHLVLHRASTFDFSLYPQAEMNPATLAFSPDISASEWLQITRQTPASLSAQQQRQGDIFAQSLGFIGGEQMLHALRHIPPEALEEWRQVLPSLSLQEAKSHLSGLVQKQMESLCQKLELPLPLYESEGNVQALWSPLARLSVYNSLVDMQTKMPLSRLRSIWAPQGEPLSFIRRQQPYMPDGQETNILALLSSSMKIAHTDTQRRVYLYDAALTMDANQITQRPEIRDFVSRLNQRSPAPDQASVDSFHQLLSLGLPGARHIPSGTALGPVTWSAMYEFELQQALKQVQDVVQDEQQLTPSQRSQLEDQVRTLQQRLAQEGIVDRQQEPLRVTSLLEDIPALFERLQTESLSVRAQQRLQDINQSLNKGVCSIVIKPQQMNKLVDTLFGILASHEGDFAEQAITHELGHIFHNQNQQTLLKSWSQISFKSHDTDYDPAFMQKAIAGLSHDHNSQSHTAFASDYAQVNAQEDFAESFRLFQRNPDQLLAKNPLKFLFMAAATGSYEGKESELLDRMRTHGHRDETLQELVRILRGTQGEYQIASVQKWSTAIEKSFLVQKIAGFFDADVSEAMKQARINTAQSASQQPIFDLPTAGALSKLETLLEMPVVDQVSAPNQESLVLNWLVQQVQRLQNSDLSTLAMSDALRHFALEGLAALPVKLQTQIPSGLQTRLADPQQRAMFLSLAYLNTLPVSMQALKTQSQAESIVTEDIDIRPQEKLGARISEHIQTEQHPWADPVVLNMQLQTWLGPELYPKLSEHFKAYLTQKDTIRLLSGNRGQTQIGTPVILAEIRNQVLAREQAAQKAFSEFKKHNSEILVSLADNAFSLGDSGLQFSQTREWCYRPLRALLEQLSPDSSRQLSISELDSFLKKVLQRPQMTSLPEGEYDSTNQDYVLRLQAAILEQIGADFPYLQRS